MADRLPISKTTMRRLDIAIYEAMKDCVYSGMESEEIIEAFTGALEHRLKKRAADRGERGTAEGRNLAKLF